MSGDVRLTTEELEALRGLPHLAIVIYVLGLRPYMDYSTRVVGVRRRVSEAGLAESCVVEPGQGRDAGACRLPSRAQVRYALRLLERAGLVERIREGGAFVFFLPGAHAPEFVRNKCDQGVARVCDQGVAKDSETVSGTCAASAPEVQPSCPGEVEPTSGSGKEKEQRHVEQRATRAARRRGPGDFECAQAEEVIRFVNRRFGKRWAAWHADGTETTTSKLIRARIKQGASVADCKKVAMRKFGEWAGSQKMARFLRPKTLFAEGNFDDYLGQCVGGKGSER